MRKPSVRRKNIIHYELTNIIKTIIIIISISLNQYLQKNIIIRWNHSSISTPFFSFLSSVVIYLISISSGNNCKEANKDTLRNNANKFGLTRAYSLPQTRWQIRHVD